MTFGRNFLPGPTGVHPDILAEMQRPMFAHYGAKMTPYLQEIQPSLQAMLGTSQPVFGVTCSGTGLLEAAIRNAVRHRVLVVVGGFFGEYFARIAEHCGKEVDRVSVPYGRTIEADQLRRLLDGPPVDAVAVVHSESSTGALAPIGDLAAVVREQGDVLLLVDAISAAAGTPIEMDRLGIDFVVTGSQKAMALPPGLAFGAVSPRLLHRARQIPDAGYYFNVPRLVDMTTRYSLFETPALSLYLALTLQLRRIADAGGWPHRWARHQALAERFRGWALDQPGVALLAPAGRQSPTVSALRLTAGQDPAAIAQALDEQGFQIGQGIGPDAPPLLRIGHMGDLEPGHLEALLAALEPLIRT